MKHKMKKAASKSPMMSEPKIKRPVMGGQTQPQASMMAGQPAMMKSGGSISQGPVGTGGMKNPNKPAHCNCVNQ